MISLSFFRVDIALNRGAHQADQQLVAIEPLLRPVGFDNLDGIFAALERRKNDNCTNSIRDDA